jgi:imidazoleglycerol phosphate dehydratase HisB
MQNPLAQVMNNAQLCREELDLAMRAHLIAAMRGDQAKVSKLRDEALTAFYAVISANEQAAHAIRKIGGR